MLKAIILRLKILVSFIRNKTVFDFSDLGKKNIFIFLGADYGNLGDVAITYAQFRFLQNNYPNYNVVEIPISKTCSGIKTIKRVIKEDDIITLIGGGNTSDLYDDIEFLRQLVIWNFRKHKIVSFPQTFHFSDTVRGRFCKLTIRWVYAKAKDLTIMAREKNTMVVLQKEFPKVNATMMPDVVMTLDKRMKVKRQGALICLRSDKEKVVSDEQIQVFISKLKEKYGIVDYQDTQVDDVCVQNRFERLEDVIQIFSTHELVITDRLHGMIFAFITGTPAIVFDNSNHKIRNSFEWIKDCGYIYFLDSPELNRINDAILTIKSRKNHFEIINKEINEIFKTQIN